MTTEIRRSLQGMLVLDMGQVYNRPYCRLLLGLMGARVLKIEPPEGDIVRRRKRHVEPYPLVMLRMTVPCSSEGDVLSDRPPPRERRSAPRGR